jgi:DNA-binding phage protein
MAISAEQLNIILSAKDKEFTRAMDRSQKRVERFAKQSNKNLSKTSAAFSKLGGAAAALLPALSAAALISSVKRITAAMDDIGKTADQIGVTTDALQELRTVAESSGVTQDELDKSIEKLGKGLAEASMGIGTAKYALEELNLSANDLMALGLDGALAKIADEVNKVENPMKKTAIATQLFGRSGAPMINLLREGSDGMERMRKEARELGVVIDEKLIRSAEESQDKLDLLSRVIDANLSSSLINLTPLLIATSSGMATLAEKAGILFNTFSQLFSDEMLPGTEIRLAEDLKSELDDAQSHLESVSQKREQIIKKAKGDDGLTDFALLSDKEFDSLTKYQTELQKTQDEISLIQSQISALPSNNLPEPPTPEEISTETAVKTIQALAAEIAANKELAELNKLKAKDAELSRIAKEKELKLETLLAQIKSGVQSETSAQNIEDAKKLIDLWEASEIAASKILNPLKQIPPAIEDTRTELQKMIDQMLEASPYLQELGFDADNLHSVMQTVEDSMESAFMSMIDGTMSAKDAFKSMAADIIRQLYRVLVVQRMVNSISNAILPGSAPAQGGAGRASGGAVQAGRPYVTGEHGRELFVPSSSGRVLSVAQSKAAVAGGGGTSVVQNFNFAANGDESVKQLIAQAAPRIAKMTEKGILDSRRRGGQMKAVFG